MHWANASSSFSLTHVRTIALSEHDEEEQLGGFDGR